MPRSSTKPRYLQVADEMRAEIETGTYSVGDALPTEQELCAAFGVSRYTVREALRRLSGLGLVRRRQGSGTEVTATSPPTTFRHAMQSLSELYEYAVDTRLDVLRMERRRPSADTARRLARPPEREWLVVEAVRRDRDEEPVSFTRIWIPVEYADLQGEIPDLEGPIHRLIETRYGVEVEEVAQEISAEPFAAPAASALGTVEGEPAIRITRRYLDAADAPLIVSDSWHPAATFRYEMRLRRKEGSA